MPKLVITDEEKKTLKQYLDQNSSAELVQAYLCYVEKKFQLDPVLFPRDRLIYQNPQAAIHSLEKTGSLWHETEIKIGFGEIAVDDQTKKIYICPFTGKVFGDNTHPNPQDAIYDWVSTCPENKERVGGLRVKRFHVSEDPDVIKNYILKEKPKEPISKIVFSSQLSGKLFNSKEAVVEDFKRNYLKRMALVEVQNQNRYQIEGSFLAFIEKQLAEDKITAFVETLSENEEFAPYVEKWLG